MSRTEVDYALDQKLREEIKCVKEKITSALLDAEVYLFGSIAKGNYSKMSDIDLLILIPAHMDTREMRYLRHELEDKIEECCLSRKVDIKLYNLDRYNELSQKPCFEQIIQTDLVSINKW